MQSKICCRCHDTGLILVLFYFRSSMRVATSRASTLAATHRCKFHQHFMSSFFTNRSQKRKKDNDDLTVFFELLRSLGINAARKHVCEIDPRWTPMSLSWRTRTMLTNSKAFTFTLKVTFHS